MQEKKNGIKTTIKHKATSEIHYRHLGKVLSLEKFTTVSNRLDRTTNLVQNDADTHELIYVVQVGMKKFYKRLCHLQFTWVHKMPVVCLMANYVCHSEQFTYWILYIDANRHILYI